MNNTTESPVSHQLYSDNAPAVNAALTAARAISIESTSLVSYLSKNHLLVIGNGGRVQDVVSRLPEGLTVSVLISAADDSFDIKVFPSNVSAGYGQLSQLSGHLGKFLAELVVKDKVVNLAQLYLPQTEYFDMVVDVSDQPLLNSSLLPFGYYSPRNDADLEQVIQGLPDMIGEFEKPRYFDYNPSICAHGNSGLQACRRCLDACPADAIISIKDAIKVDPYKCQGGGVCATVCPSGAIQYVYPRLQDILAKLRAMLKAYYQAGGKQAAIVFYGEAESSLMEQASLAGAIPFQLEETASVGMEVWLSAFAYGAREVVLLSHVNAVSESIDAIDSQMSYAHAIMAGMGFDQGCLRRQSISDASLPQAYHRSDSFSVVKPSTYMALNDKRSALHAAVHHLYQCAPASQEIVDLPAGAPFGEVQVNKNNCTLCMACVSVCPASALADGDDLPQLRFTEANCVQCGLCSRACPESALSLVPRYNYVGTVKRSQRILHEEQPFCCTSCGKAFATQSVIDSITAKLSQHPMFQTEVAINRLTMCDDCRVRDMFSSELGAS